MTDDLADESRHEDETPETPQSTWPSGEKLSGEEERWGIEINPDGSVKILDHGVRTWRTWRTFYGAGALAEAVKRRAELIRRAELGLTEEPTPSAFLTETLPAYARVQRLEGMLAEVRTAESAALNGLTEAITLLNRAVSLRERLEKALKAATRPFSATEAGEQAPPVRCRCPRRPCEHSGGLWQTYAWSQDSNSPDPARRSWVTETSTARTTGLDHGTVTVEFNSAGLSKPQPY